MHMNYIQSWSTECQKVTIRALKTLNLCNVTTTFTLKIDISSSWEISCWIVKKNISTTSLTSWWLYTWPSLCAKKSQHACPSLSSMHTQHILLLYFALKLWNTNKCISNKAKNTKSWSRFFFFRSTIHCVLFVDQKRRILQLRFDLTFSRSEPKPKEMKDVS